MVKWFDSSMLLPNQGPYSSLVADGYIRIASHYAMTKERYYSISVERYDDAKAVVVLVPKIVNRRYKSVAVFRKWL